MRYVSYIGVTVFLALLIVLQLVALGPAEYIPVLLVLLTHFPAFLTVAVQRSIFGLKHLKIYPEMTVVPMILAVWSLVGALIGNIWIVSAVGVLVAAALSLLYASVRLLRFFSGRSIGGSSSPIEMWRAPGTLIGLRSIYLLRVTVATVSLISLSLLILGGEKAQSSILMLNSIFAPISVLAAAAIGYSMSQMERPLLRPLPSVGKLMVQAELGKNPVDAAVHYSDPASKEHRAIIKFVEDLNSQEISTTIIAREERARNFLQGLITSKVWFAPTISSLSYFSDLNVPSIFYINDAVKNGHFIRFNKYVHVLVATGTFAMARSLPRNFAMYDAIVAPDTSTAELWQRSLDVSSPLLIATVERNDGLELLPARANAPAPSAIALHVGPDPVTKHTNPALRTGLRAVIDACLKLDSTELIISFPQKKQNDRLGITLEIEARRIANSAKNSNISLLTGPLALSANAADAVIVTDVSNLSGLRKTGKPLFWLGRGKAPIGLYSIGKDGSGLSDVLNKLTDETTVVTDREAEEESGIFHFPDYASMIEFLGARKFRRKIKV